MGARARPGSQHLEDGATVLAGHRHPSPGRFHSSRMCLSGRSRRSDPVTTSRSWSWWRVISTATGPPRSRVASAAQKYAAASTRGSKRRPVATSSTTNCVRSRPGLTNEASAVGDRSGRAGREDPAGDLRVSPRAVSSEPSSGPRSGPIIGPAGSGRWWDSCRSRCGSGSRCVTTRRAMARSSLRRSASPALISRRRESSSSPVR